MRRCARAGLKRTAAASSRSPRTCLARWAGTSTFGAAAATGRRHSVASSARTRATTARSATRRACPPTRRCFCCTSRRRTPSGCWPRCWMCAAWRASSRTASRCCTTAMTAGRRCCASGCLASPPTSTARSARSSGWMGATTRRCGARRTRLASPSPASTRRRGSRRCVSAARTRRRATWPRASWTASCSTAIWASCLRSRLPCCAWRRLRSAPCTARL
mmetsp:Transcript_21897/g.72587  ORF Transcript_21897/g.72587 Transcript_21897/m.72587 type:complete len:219 (-) Transcript_21897:313-969(-)